MTNPLDELRAFPRPAVPLQDRAGYHPGQDGMTLRDYFAGIALGRLIVEASYSPYDIIAKMAFEMADAMIAERNGE